MTTSYNGELGTILAKLDDATESDWSNPRSRIYIAATINEANCRAEKALLDLEMERSVNRRVLELLKEAFVERLARSSFEEC